MIIIYSILSIAITLPSSTSHYCLSDYNNLLIGSSCLPFCPFWCTHYTARLFYLKLDPVTPFLKMLNLFVVYSASLLHASAFAYVVHCAWKALSTFLITYLANAYSSFKLNSGTVHSENLPWSFLCTLVMSCSYFYCCPNDTIL